MHDALLAVHVVAGTAGLLLGPAWVAVRLRGRPGWGAAAGYQAAVVVVALTGGGLAWTAPGLRWLLPVAGCTAALGIAGAVARSRSWPHWRTLQPHLLGGSYIALVTGSLVASTGSPVWWAVPAVVGQVPIAVAKHRLAEAPA